MTNNLPVIKAPFELRMCSQKIRVLGKSYFLISNEFSIDHNLFFTFYIIYFSIFPKPPPLCVSTSNNPPIRYHPYEVFSATGSPKPPLTKPGVLILVISPAPNMMWTGCLSSSSSLEKSNPCKYLYFFFRFLMSGFGRVVRTGRSNLFALTWKQIQFNSLISTMIILTG